MESCEGNFKVKLDKLKPFNKNLSAYCKCIVPTNINASGLYLCVFLVDIFFDLTDRCPEALHPATATDF